MPPVMFGSRSGRSRPSEHDRCDHPGRRHLHLRLGSVALPRFRRGERSRRRWGMSSVGVVEQVESIKVGDFVVGLLAVLAAKELGAERIIAMSRHADRQALAREFGATRHRRGTWRRRRREVKELTDGLGAYSVVEAVGPRSR